MCCFPCPFGEKHIYGSVIKNPCCYKNINTGSINSSGGGGSNNNNDIIIIHQTVDKKKETSFPSQPQLHNRLKTAEVSVSITIMVC